MKKKKLQELFEQARLHLDPESNYLDTLASMYYLIEGFYEYLEQKDNS